MVGVRSIMCMSKSDLGKCLWQPTPEQISASQLTAFMSQAAKTYNAPTEWKAFWAWSVSHPQEFWPLLWSFTKIKCSVPWSEVTIGDNIMQTRFFTGARLNYAENLLTGAAGLDEAIIFHGEGGVRRALSGQELQELVTRLQRVFRTAGVGEGDSVAAITANVPEAVAAALAAASLGAAWTSCSPDFGSSGVLERFTQVAPKLLFVTNGYSYNGKWYSSIELVQNIEASLPSVQKVVLCDYETGHIDALQEAIHLEPLNFVQTPFDHPLYIMFSSGTTGLPKCMIHGAGGTLLQHLKEHQLHIDLRPGERMLFFTTCGWMMWNWLVSALASQVTIVLYDGSPLYPSPERLFDIVEAEHVAGFGVSARYIEATFKAGIRPCESHDLSALRVVMSTGSPLAPHCFEYVYQDWKSDVRLSSMSGGTDIVSCFATGNPNLAVHSGEIQCLTLGMNVQVFDDEGKALNTETGELVCVSPHPSQPVAFLNDPDNKKYRAAYFEAYPGVWHHGDWCKTTKNEGLVIYGRSDSTLNPGGVRIGTAEIYRQVEQIEEVLEAVVIGQDLGDKIGGDTRIVLFVRLAEGRELTQDIETRIKAMIRKNTSPRHVPSVIAQVLDIPRTKSGKVVELAVRNVVHGRAVKNINALANPEALKNFANRPELALDEPEILANPAE